MSKRTLMVEMDQEELACRMLEAMYGLKRPPDATPRQCLSSMEPQDREAIMRGAMSAMIYLRQCVQAGRPSQ